MNNIDPQLISDVAAFRKKNPRAGRETIRKEFDLTGPEARAILRRLGSKDYSKEQRAPKFKENIEEDIVAARHARTLRDADLASKRYKQLLQRVAAERELIEDFRVVLEDMRAEGQLNIPIARPEPQKKDASRTPEAAVLVLSDSHIGKIIDPAHTLGFGHYNPKIYCDRLFFIEATVAQLIKEHLSNPVDTLHILLLGDIVEGMLNHAEEVPNRWLVANQVLLATVTLYQFIAKLSLLVPKIVDRGVGGNHARWPNQKKPPTQNRFSNFDYVVFGQLASMFEMSGPANVRFQLDEGAFQVFEIFKWKFKIGHGDHLKGGDRALGIPAHSIAREISATTARYAAKGENPPDYYIVGDKHKPFMAGTARGRYLINGAWFTDDEYALTENFGAVRPFQMFFGVHPLHGRSWSYDLHLDVAPTLAKPPYVLPATLSKRID